MKTRNVFGILVLAILAVALLPIARAADGARPANETYTVQRIYGPPTRPVLADGGGLGMYVIDGGTGCMVVTGGQVYIFGWCDVNVNVCFAGGTGEMPIPGPTFLSDGGLADAGVACSSVITNPYYGWPLPANTPAGPFVMQSNTKQVCVHPTSGATANCSGFLSR